MLFGGIEAGGTKFVCGIGNKNGEIVERISFPTTKPEETMKQVIEFFKEKDIKALGVGSFGPIDPDLNSKTYGYITSTPKPYWSNYDMIGELKKNFNNLKIKEKALYEERLKKHERIYRKNVKNLY